MGHVMAKTGSIGTVELEESCVHNISTEKSLKDGIFIRILNWINSNFVPSAIRHELLLDFLTSEIRRERGQYHHILHDPTINAPSTTPILDSRSQLDHRQILPEGI